MSGRLTPARCSSGLKGVEGAMGEFKAVSPSELPLDMRSGVERVRRCLPREDEGGVT